MKSAVLHAYARHPGTPPPTPPPVPPHPHPLPSIAGETRRGIGPPPRALIPSPSLQARRLWRGAVRPFVPSPPSRERRAWAAAVARPYFNLFLPFLLIFSFLCISLTPNTTEGQNSLFTPLLACVGPQTIQNGT